MHKTYALSENEEIIRKVSWRIDGHNFCLHRDTAGKCIASRTCSDGDVCWFVQDGFDVTPTEAREIRRALWGMK
jgi:hypothetical protein